MSRPIFELTAFLNVKSLKGDIFYCGVNNLTTWLPAAVKKMLTISVPASCIRKEKC